MRDFLKNFLADKSGSVAPTIGLSLFMLVAAGGVGFDYARLAAMDTELQSAADQAALAAATQLDGEANARARAIAAASNLVKNSTLLASDQGDKDATSATADTCDDTASTAQVRVCGLIFYKTYIKRGDAGNVVATSDADANVVEVRMQTRRADYAFTPIVAAVSGETDSRAVAGMSGAVCGVVPFFVCSPSEPEGNTNPYLAPSIPPGTGIKMMEGGQQKGPGNFGFLAYAGRGAANLAEALSADSLNEDCVQATSVETEGGQKEAVFKALNERFNVILNGNTCPSGSCSPSINERKDLVREANACNWKENQADDTNYQTRRYRPTTAAALPTGTTPEIMGFPRDLCHATGADAVCSGPDPLIGNGEWDRAAYFRSNHPAFKDTWSTTTGLGPTVSRYQTYLWEVELRDNSRLTPPKASSQSGWAAYSTATAGACKPTGIHPIDGGKDRRKMTAAVVNCRAYGKINGRKSLPVASYIDVFLVEPSWDRTKCDGNKAPCKDKVTNRDDIYVEVVGVSGTGEGGALPQITRRNVPRLIE